MDPIDLVPETEDYSTILSASSSSLPTKVMASLLQHQSNSILHYPYPLVSIRISLILPHGFDTRLEEVVLRIAVELRGRFEPVKIRAKVFGGVEFANDGKAGFITIGVSQA